MDSALVADDDWEVVNDDGFVYKRKRRRLDPSAGPPLPPPPPAADPLQEERQRRERKRTTLLKLKNQYRRELDQWEHLSNTLKAMEEKSLQLRQQERDQTASCAASSSGSGKEMDRACGSVVDELLLQVEAQEAMIRDFSNLCDVAEAMCNAEDERVKQSLIDLPVWASSPYELMASLCDE